MWSEDQRRGCCLLVTCFCFISTTPLLLSSSLPPRLPPSPTPLSLPNLTFPWPLGVGLDFNSQLVEAITKVRGANYFSVHTPGEFKRRLVDEFDFAVT